MGTVPILVREGSSRQFMKSEHGVSLLMLFAAQPTSSQPTMAAMHRLVTKPGDFTDSLGPDRNQVGQPAT